MASSINKYAQNIARARYATPSYSGPQRRATIDPSLFSGKGTTAAKGAPLASRPIEGGPALPSPKEYNAIIDAESGEDPNAPRVETQQPITQPGFDPRFMIQGGGPRIDLSGFFPERANTAYDPNKAIGGENVPYKPAGFFRSFLGDPANRKNVEAQQGQAAEWKADAALAKERQNRREDLDYEIAARNKESARQFDIEQKRLADKAIQDEIKGYEDEAVKLAREGNEDVLKDADMVRKERADADKLALEERKVKLAEDVANKARYRTIQTEKGGATVIDEHTGKPLRTYHPPTIGMITDPKTGKETAGNIPGRWEEYTERPKLPANLIGGGAQVNRADGSTFGGPLVAPTRSGISLDSALSEPAKLPPGGGVRMGGALPAPPQNTALVPRFMQGAGDVLGGVMTSATDPLRYAGKEMYKQLLNSGAQQDPEVLKRLKKREEESSPWDIQ